MPAETDHKPWTLEVVPGAAYCSASLPQSVLSNPPNRHPRDDDQGFPECPDYSVAPTNNPEGPTAESVPLEGSAGIAMFQKPRNGRVSRDGVSTKGLRWYFMNSDVLDSPFLPLSNFVTVSCGWV